jgi:hypothetical protein
LKRNKSVFRYVPLAELILNDKEMVPFLFYCHYLGFWLVCSILLFPHFHVELEFLFAIGHFISSDPDPVVYRLPYIIYTGIRLSTQAVRIKSFLLEVFGVPYMIKKYHTVSSIGIIWTKKMSHQISKFEYKINLIGIVL